MTTIKNSYNHSLFCITSSYFLLSFSILRNINRMNAKASGAVVVEVALSALSHRCNQRRKGHFGLQCLRDLFPLHAGFGLQS